MPYNVGVADAATTSATLSRTMEIVYSTRPLTREECILARHFIRNRVLMAGLVLLSMRLDSPQFTLEEVIDMDPQDVRGFLIGLLRSIDADYSRQSGLDALEMLATEVRH